MGVSLFTLKEDYFIGTTTKDRLRRAACVWRSFLLH